MQKKNIIWYVDYKKTICKLKIFFENRNIQNDIDSKSLENDFK